MVLIALAAFTILAGSAVWAREHGARAIGAQRYVVKYNGPGSGTDTASAVAATPDGIRVFVTGKSDSGTDYGFGTVAYDMLSPGQLWAANWSGPGDSLDEGSSVGVSPQGEVVYVAGYSVRLPDQRTGAVTVAYDAATGSRRWIAVEPAYPGGATSTGVPLAVSPTSPLVFVAAFVSGGPGGGDFGTFAFDAFTGTRLWSARFSGSAGENDWPRAIVVSPDGGRVFVTGETHVEPGDQGDYVTIAYDALTGDRQWAVTFSGTGDYTDRPADVDVSPDSSTVYVTGLSEGYGTLAYDAATGSEIWTAIYDPYQRVGSDATALALDPGGEVVYVTGGAGLNYGTVAYDASTGAQLWDSIYTGGNGDDQAQAIGVSPDGTRVYVTGRSQGSNGYYDYATVAYSAATGTKLGVDRYDGPAHQHDEAWDLAVGSDGWLYMTGSSFIGYTRYDDYVTIAYRP